MNDESRSSSRWLAYLQLMRLPNVFTAMADVAMGYLLTHATVSHVGELAHLLITSSALYTAGMVLNDVFDRRADAKERPWRPIPSGRVTVWTAVALSLTLLAVATISAVAIGVFAHRWGPLMLAGVLVVFIVSYDAHFKHTAGGPLAMGICRMLNVLLGMSAAKTSHSTANDMVACGIGLYIAGVTWFAARETTSSGRGNLAGALAIMLAGIGLAFSSVWKMPAAMLAEWFSLPRWILLWCLVAVMIGWRFVIAIVQPQPPRVQAAVKSGILLVIVLDAVLVAPMHGPAATLWILLLLAPAMVLGRWVYST